VRVITVANHKGGVGKTTTAVSLGGLACAQGSRVLLVDLDPHGSLSTYFRQDPDTQKFGVYTLFQERKELTATSVKRLICNTNYPQMDLLPASTALATLERQSIGQDGMGLVLARALALVYEDYDIVFIDTPPLLGVLMINALAACQHLVIPVQTEFLALKGLERMVHTLAMMTRSRKKALEYTILPLMYDRRTHSSIVSLRAIRNTYGEQAWASQIPVDTKFRDASRAGVPPHLFDESARGVEAYKSFYKWLMPKIMPETTQVKAGGLQ
jgi:chromosome partitioning protein